ncbi:MAG: spore coat protein [Clostridiales bacterium]|nr:spore coat protein [Clostridiales bacterium]
MDNYENYMPFSEDDKYDSVNKDGYTDSENAEDEYTPVDPSFGVDTTRFVTKESTDLSELYKGESEDDENERFGSGTYGGANEYGDTVEYDPSDETAATCDWNCDCNDTTNAQKRCSLDDYEIISDVLGCEKQLVKLYSTALCESAEEPLRNIIKENLIECAKDQYETFEYMSSRGLYETEQADVSKINEAKKQFGSVVWDAGCNCGCND